VNIDGTGVGYILLLTVGGSVMLDGANNPVRLTGPGGFQIFDPPFTAPGTAGPAYVLVCKAIAGGSISYNFSQ
jgi:hypothetical protein